MHPLWGCDNVRSTQEGFVSSGFSEKRGRYFIYDSYKKRVVGTSYMYLPKGFVGVALSRGNTKPHFVFAAL